MFDPSENVVYDYIGGVEDLRNSKVRTVSAANLSFVEDTGQLQMQCFHHWYERLKSICLEML
jgi:hypothetical protein